MKRITLLMVAFLGSIALQAQTVLAEQAPDFGSGIVADYFEDTSIGVYSGDDFELTSDSELSVVEIYGFQGDEDEDGTPETDLISTMATGFSLYIYADNGGVPAGDPTTAGTGELEVVDISISDPALTITEDGTGNYVFAFDIEAYNGAPLTLTAGTYWLVAFPHIDATLGSGARFNWFGSTQGSLSGAQLIDPDNMFGAGATSWTPISLLVGDPAFNALAYTITGEEVLSIDDAVLAQISLYPNPVQDQLNITLPASVELEAATMFDLLGQATKMNISESNTLNTSNLATGVYVLKLQTSQGTLTKKVIKQ